MPKVVMRDTIARRWVAVWDAAPAASRWDQKAVEQRLEEAMVLLRRVGGPYGPKEFGTSWPAIAEAIEAPEGGAELPARVTSADVSKMEAAIRWPLTYLGGRPGRARYPDQLRVLQIWLACKATGGRFGKAIQRRGIAESTGQARRWQAMLLIATGLMEDGVPAPEEPAEAPAEGWGSALQAPEPPPAPVEDEPTAPPELWERCRAALAKRRPYESPRQIVNGMLIEQVKTEFAGLGISKRLLADMETRRRQLRVLARREGLLDDGGPR
jgi:hypothetical protein